MISFDNRSTRSEFLRWIPVRPYPISVPVLFASTLSNDLPAGRLKTPAPTMLLMRLKTSFGMVAVPPPCDFSAAPPRGSSAAALAASFPRRGVVEDTREFLLPGISDEDEGMDWRVGVSNALVETAKSNTAVTVEVRKNPIMMEPKDQKNNNIVDRLCR